GGRNPHPHRTESGDAGERDLASGGQNEGPHLAARADIEMAFREEVFGPTGKAREASEAHCVGSHRLTRTQLYAPIRFACATGVRDNKGQSCARTQLSRIVAAFPTV